MDQVARGSQHPAGAEGPSWPVSMPLAIGHEPSLTAAGDRPFGPGRVGDPWRPQPPCSRDMQSESMTEVPTAAVSCTERPTRRALPRQFADWSGRFRLDGPSDSQWRDCRIVDVSSAGAGIALTGVVPEELLGNDLLLVIHLRGVVRHARFGGDDEVFAGLEFLAPSESWRTHLRSLIDLNEHS